MTSALPIARLFGFEIRVHVSWAVILAIAIVTIESQIATIAPEIGSTARWAIGGAIAASFLVSALAHELGHAIAARRAGVPGGTVVVYFFGGAASTHLESATPRAEIGSALAGPIVSIVIGALVLAAAGAAHLVGGAGVGVGRAALVVGVMNVALGVVNLLPAYPLDGGRVIRALAWRRTGDPTAGLRIAASSGRYLGILLATIGIVSILVLDPIDGLMLALAGWFLVSSSRAVERSAEIEHLLEGVRVRDVMQPEVSGVPPGLTLDTFAEQLLGTDPLATVPVMRGLDLVGMIGSRQVRRLRRDRWPETRAEDLMVSGDALPRLSPEASLRSALDQLRRSGLDGLPVMDAGALAGIVTRRAVAEAIHERLQRSRPGDGAIPGRP